MLGFACCYFEACPKSPRSEGLSPSVSSSPYSVTASPTISSGGHIRGDKAANIESLAIIDGSKTNEVEDAKLLLEFCILSHAETPNSTPKAGAKRKRIRSLGNSVLEEDKDTNIRSGRKLLSMNTPNLLRQSLLNVKYENT